MNKIVIFGIEKFAEMIYSLLQEQEENCVYGFCIDMKYMPAQKEKYGLPIVPFEEIQDFFPASEFSVIFCIGYTDMNRLRKARMETALKLGYQVIGYTHPTAIIQAEKVGIGNIFMEGVICGQNSQIGDGNIFWPMAHVAHHTCVGSYNFFTISSVVAGNIKIADYCIFGANCTVKNGVNIAEGTLVGAGAYISKDTEPWSVYAPPRTYKLEGKKSTDFKL